MLAVDPFYFGESRIEQRDFLFALLVAAIGQRPLGTQAQQLAAVARWAKESSAEPGQSVSLEVYGRRAGVIGLTAAALESGAISELVLHGSFASLRDLIDEGIGVDQAPELFCFGLLESLDVLQLAALVSAPPGAVSRLLARRRRGHGAAAIPVRRPRQSLVDRRQQSPVARQAKRCSRSYPRQPGGHETLLGREARVSWHFMTLTGLLRSTLWRA